MNILSAIANAVVYLPLILGTNDVKIGSRVEISTNADVGALVQASDLSTGQWLGMDTADDDGWVEFTAIVGNDLMIAVENESIKCYHLPIDAINPINAKAELRSQDKFVCPWNS